jgi:hypothetical protein
MLALSLLFCLSLAAFVNADCDFPLRGTGNCDEVVTEDNWSVHFDNDLTNPAVVAVTLAASTNNNFRFSFALGSDYEIDVDPVNNDYRVNIRERTDDDNDDDDDDDDSANTRGSALMVFLLFTLAALGFQSPTKRSSVLLIALLVVFMPVAKKSRCTCCHHQYPNFCPQRRYFHNRFRWRHLDLRGSLNL